MVGIHLEDLVLNLFLGGLELLHDFHFVLWCADDFEELSIGFESNLSTLLEWGIVSSIADEVQAGKLIAV